VLGYENSVWQSDAKFFEHRVHGEDLQRMREMFDSLCNGHETDARCDHRMERADGSVIWVHSGVHCEDEAGHRLLRGVTIDIDDVKRAEERERAARADAEQLAQARDEVLAVVAHDLRSPLHSLELACELLDDDATRERSVQLIRRAARQMGSLIDDLLDAASIRAGRLRLASAEFDVDALVREVVDDFAGRAHEIHIALEMSAAADQAPILVAGDPQRVRQVLNNLLQNALKFTEPTGHVTVRLVSDPERVRVEVRDTGRGISAQDRDKVFDRAWQSDETAHLGSGMGLYITKGIVVAHGGTIGVDSEPGQGSVFYFTLPRKR
jgi:PAS domain S-box-containing protein